MDFDQEAVGAGGQRCSGHRRHVVALAGAMAGIDQNRQVRQRLYRRDDGQVERIAAMVRKRPYAPLAEDDVVIAAGEQVFGRHQPFLERSRHPAFEQNRPP